jgi:hypothetical protein
MINARVRIGASWSDALILNMSSKGLLVRSDQSADRGSYLEIHRGSHIIVARVIWSKSGRFGVQTQDPVPAASLIRDPDEVSIQAKPAAPGVRERRGTPRPAEIRHQDSRHQARAREFAAIALACGFSALFAGNLIVEVVAKPLGEAQAALAGN